MARRSPTRPCTPGVAVPVSGSVGPKVFFGYQVLREHGPNDGVVMLADTVWPGGVNLVALGADHLFSSRPGDAYDSAPLRAWTSRCNATVSFATARSRARAPPSWPRWRSTDPS